jgi:hypothetical protein
MPLLASGGTSDFELGTRNQPLKVQRAGGKEISLTTDDNGKLRDVSTDLPGLYSIRDATGRELRRFAVNLPSVESDLSSMTPADFQQDLAKRNEPMSKTAALFGQSSRGKELWRVLLLGALALMLVEPLVANRTHA